MKVLIAAVLLLFTMAAYPSQGQVIAYDASVQPGNQNWSGNLGLDFDVNSSVFVTALGAFDSNGDGFVNPISVGIFNRDTQLLMGVKHTFQGHADTLVNGDRFFSLGVCSFVLPPGHYSVVAVGFSASDLNGNSTVGAPFTASTENTGGSLISFVGTGRYDSNTSLLYPTVVPGGAPSNVFLAGTFQFRPLEVFSQASWWFWFVN